MKRVHLFIHGDVVGVGFRAWTVRTAKELKLTGWVKNREDKTVEVIAEGEEKILEEFIKRCHHGPEVAWVERVEEKWEEGPLACGEEFVGFEVRY